MFDQGACPIRPLLQFNPVTEIRNLLRCEIRCAASATYSLPFRPNLGRPRSASMGQAALGGLTRVSTPFQRGHVNVSMLIVGGDEFGPYRGADQSGGGAESVIAPVVCGLDLVFTAQMGGELVPPSTALVAE